MMFGSIFVSMIGIALPIVVGVWIMPSGESVTDCRIHLNANAANGRCCGRAADIMHG